MTFSTPIKKEIKEQSEQNKQNKQKKKSKIKVITYNLKSIDSARHMNRALSTLVDNFSEINKSNCEETKDKNMKLKIKRVNDKKTLITTCKTCKTCKSKESQLIRDLIKKFPSTYKLCNKTTAKFITLLNKGVYPYEYMDSMNRFDETTLPNIEKFYSNLQ